MALSNKEVDRLLEQLKDDDSIIFYFNSKRIDNNEIFLARAFENDHLIDVICERKDMSILFDTQVEGDDYSGYNFPIVLRARVVDNKKEFMYIMDNGGINESWKPFNWPSGPTVKNLFQHILSRFQNVRLVY